jgi:hypothetical protein
VMVEAALLTVSTEELDFGDKLGRLPLVLGNEGNIPLEWTVVETVDWLESDVTGGTVEPDGLQALEVTADRARLTPGEYVAQLTIVSNDERGSVTLPVRMVVLENNVPFADAGPDQTVVEGEAVQLDGSGSRDDDGDTLTYLWEAPADVALRNTTAVRASFLADRPGEFRIHLTVSDGASDSAPDAVVVTVSASTADADIIGEIVDDGQIQPLPEVADAEIVGKMEEEAPAAEPETADAEIVGATEEDLADVEIIGEIVGEAPKPASEHAAVEIVGEVAEEGAPAVELADAQILGEMEEETPAAEPETADAEIVGATEEDLADAEIVGEMPDIIRDRAAVEIIGEVVQQGVPTMGTTDAEIVGKVEEEARETVRETASAEIVGATQGDVTDAEIVGKIREEAPASVRETAAAEIAGATAEDATDAEIVGEIVEETPATESENDTANAEIVGATEEDTAHADVTGKIED